MIINFRVDNKWAEAFGQKLEQAIVKTLDQFQKQYVHNIITEAPKDSGNLVSDIQIKRPKRISPGIVSGKIIIGANTPYAWAVWKGLNPDFYSVFPKFGSYMIFPVPAKWPQYDGRFGNISYFITKQTLRNNIPPNDFIGRAKRKTKAQVKFGKVMAIQYNKMRKK